jgi:alpha-amylase
VNIPALDCLPSLLILRKEYSYGEQVDYFHDPNCVGWIRRGDETIPQSGCAVLLSNHPTKKMCIRMTVGKKFAGKRFYDFLKKDNREVSIDEEGMGEFYVEPGTIAVWVPEGCH